MFLSASPSEAFRASEIVEQNKTAVVQAPVVLPRLLLAVAVGLVLYHILQKGLK